MNGETLIHFEDGQSGIVRKMTVDEWFAMECARERYDEDWGRWFGLSDDDRDGIMDTLERIGEACYRIQWIGGYGDYAIVMLPAQMQNASDAEMDDGTLTGTVARSSDMEPLEPGTLKIWRETRDWHINARPASALIGREQRWNFVVAIECYRAAMDRWAYHADLWQRARGNY